MWVHKHELNNSLVVFIHGIFGSRYGTWKGLVDSVQRLTDSDPLIGSYDFYFFQYDSGVWQPNLDSFVLDDLHRFLQQVEAKYTTIAFVCHSQGGIVGKLYVLRELSRPAPCKVQLIITFGTPHRGVTSATPLLWLQNIPILGRVIPFRQLGGLSPLSKNMRRLRDEWPVILERAGNALHVVNLVGAYDKFVSERSAAGFRGETRRGVYHGHVLQPRTPLIAIGDEIADVLRRHRPQDDVRQQIDAIRRSSAALQQYIGDNHQRVRDFLREHVPVSQANTINTRVSALLVEFLNDFERRPLRNLDLQEALACYVRRRLEVR